ncbi:MAG: DDE-type integrase/transposase/recombinase [Conexivisphaera sp.]
MRIDPIRELAEAIRAIGVFRRNKIPIEEKARAVLLYMAGLSSWEIAEELGVSHASVLDWARAVASMPGSVPPRERRLVAVDETELKVNGRMVYVWAAMDVDTRELLAMEATWSRSSLHALLFLRKVLGRCTNKPLFVADRGPWYGWAFRSLGLSYYHETFGIRSRIERFFRTLKRRTKVFSNNVNARRLQVHALNTILSIFQLYYNWLRYHKGIGGIPALLSMGGGLI